MHQKFKQVWEGNLLAVASKMVELEQSPGFQHPAMKTASMALSASEAELAAMQKMHTDCAVLSKTSSLAVVAIARREAVLLDTQLRDLHATQELTLTASTTDCMEQYGKAMAAVEDDISKHFGTARLRFLQKVVAACGRDEYFSLGRSVGVDEDLLQRVFAYTPGDLDSARTVFIGPSDSPVDDVTILVAAAYAVTGAKFASELNAKYKFFPPPGDLANMISPEMASLRKWAGVASGVLEGAMDCCEVGGE